MSQDRRIVRVVVLTAPTVSFPLPGVPEINFIARIHDDHIAPEGDYSIDPKWWVGDRIVPVVIGPTADSLPKIGTEIQVKEYNDFYQGRGEYRLSRL